MNTHSRGLVYEDIACSYLERNGYIILKRNYMPTRFSEIDILAKDGECGDIVAFEVKGIKATWAEEYIYKKVNASKIAKIRKALNIFMQNIDCESSRVDVLLISPPKLLHYKDVR